MMQLPCAFLLCEGIFMMHRYNQSSDYDKTKIQPYHDMAVRCFLPPQKENMSA